MNMLLEANTGEQTKKSQVLLCGDAGTAKTSNVLLYAGQKEEREGVGFDFKKSFLMKRINFSFATTPGLLQEAIQEELEQKGSTLVPRKNDVSQMFFIDDLSMPEMNK
jgi:dynein heavy chain